MSVYDTDGLFVRSLGKGTLKDPCDITAANDGHVMVVDRGDSCVHIFSEDGDCPYSFKLQGHYNFLKIAFHRLSEYVVIAGEKEELAVVEIFTNDFEFMCSTQIHVERIGQITGMTVTRDG